MESPGNDLSVFHFSHPHPLELTTSSPPTSKSTCSGCKLNITSGKSYYGCKSCGFCLHYFCYKLPIITQHPAHSSHDLVLLVIRSSPAATKGTIKCQACGYHVTAFCYHCAECTIYFHTFCLALPLSLSITYHPHKLKLEFSPPYDFFCDMCKKTSYNGWLYRCNFCEFDMHLACAVQNLDPPSLRHPSFSQSNTLLRKIGSPQVTRINGGTGDNSIGSEILHLMAQQIGGDIRGNSGRAKVIGWDKRIYSPRQSRTASVELQLTEPSPSRESGNLEGRTPLQDKLTPRSDVSTPPSYQFSDACFSIDLAKSYAESRSLAEAKGTSRTTSNSGEAKEPLAFVNWPSFNSYNAAQQSRMNASFLNSGRTSSFAEPSQKAATHKHKLSQLGSERFVKDRSCWKKLVSCCL
ncbi:uncharacterized protein LOC129306942 [Prosopis cineraria]|uniref:uncharacterized protein LOC129306942 n=1 Tax=Prosopis cineraria TaxID=364024 RepID=UPI00240F58CF|nr:uncharacterized protein LOC129306942 [Prosopis cineraria]